MLVALDASLVILMFSKSIYRSLRVNELGRMLLSVMGAWLAAVVFVLASLFFLKSSSEILRLWFTNWG